MSKILKLYSKSSTYVDKLNSSKNYSKSNSIFCGCKSDLKYKDYFSSIINFSKVNINTSSIKTAFLFIYISELKALKESPTNLYLTSSTEEFNISQINYENYKNNIITKPLPINFHSILINSYTKINITHMLKEIIQNNSNFNIILDTTNEHPTYFLKINSVNSKYAPYIEIILKDDNFENADKSITSMQNNSLSYDDIIEIIDKQNKIISNISMQISNLTDLIKEYRDLFSNFTTSIKKENQEKKTTIDNVSKNIIYPSNSNNSLTNRKSAITIVKKDINSRINLIKSNDNK